MPIFIKTEIIKKEFIFNNKLKKKLVDKHILWIKELKKAGVKVKSGFLVNEIKEPGAGGLLTIEVRTYKDALKIVKEDPMIKSKIVDWELNEWIDISPD
ncbi:YciI family protein [uncultured Prochlorococcus sp.]|uniref:YciI family protein n=1 Tax=uncultured Prochlorococcus sp. TaxID=159733 RepID=UPI002583333D|nr:YciI family protein [uncultured Prochlorococcus sp.]